MPIKSLLSSNKPCTPRALEEVFQSGHVTILFHPSSPGALYYTWNPESKVMESRVVWHLTPHSSGNSDMSERAQEASREAHNGLLCLKDFQVFWEDSAHPDIHASPHPQVWSKNEDQDGAWGGRQRSLLRLSVGLKPQT